MTTTKSIALFIRRDTSRSAAPGWWQGVREHRGWTWARPGVIGLGAYGFIATPSTRRPLRVDPCAYGGVKFVVGSPLGHDLRRFPP